MAKPQSRTFGAGRFSYVAGDGTQSPSVERKLVESLFGHHATLLMGASSMVLLGMLEWWRLDSFFWLGWVGAIISILAWRWRQVSTFERFANRINPQSWARRFAYGAWATGVLWGTGGVIVMATTDDALARFLFISVEAAYIGSGAFRNNASPAAAIGQVCLSQVPLLISCLATGNAYYVLYSAILVAHILSNVSLVEFLSERTVRFLVSDENNELLARQIAQVNEQLERSNEQLSLLAATDGLTGLPNRRSFDTTLASEWQRAVRSEEALSLLMVDVDKFKSYNDTFGHQSGDQCLRMVATALQSAIQRATDLAARYGGEEFAVILPATDEAGARVMAERGRVAVLALGLPGPNEDNPSVSVSIGAATIHPRPGSMSEDLLAAADEALYAAKEAGRNCVHFRSPHSKASTAMVENPVV
jgi:diguanylate cyclase (GGDEF)-like protein